jgi:membrane protein implicated in regulation of membrane protease activity
MASRNYLNRPLADGIRKVGFRKWYERELLSSHAHMVLALLCTIALMAALELLNGGGPADKLFNVLLFILSGAVGLWALRRYLYLLSNAETVADQANCSQCAEYGRLTVIEEDRRNGQVLVKCRKCNHEWTLIP